MAWVRLDDQFLTHPKALAAGKNGRALFIAGLLYSAGQLTDGKIARTQLPLLAAAAEVPGPSTARKLVEVGLWDADGDDWIIHDFHDHNPPAAEVKAKRERERERKAEQRSRGSQAVQNGKGGRFMSRTESQGDTHRDTQGESRRESPATRPRPPKTPSSPPPPTSTEPPPTTPDAGAPGEEDRTPEPTPHQIHTTVEAALAHMAECDQRRHTAEGNTIRTPAGWLRTATENRRRANGADLERLARNSHPDIDPVNLAEAIDPTCGPHDGGLARSLAAHRTQQAELDAQDAAANDYRQRATEAETWLEANPDHRTRLLEHVDPTGIPATGKLRDGAIRRQLIALAIDELHPKADA